MTVEHTPTCAVWNDNYALAYGPYDPACNCGAVARRAAVANLKPYCEIGDGHRRHEGDCVRLFDEDSRKAAAWEKRLEQARATVAAHEAGCVVCVLRRQMAAPGGG